MNIRSIANKTMEKVTGKSVYKATEKPADLSDKFSNTGKAEKLDADKMKSLKLDKGKQAWGGSGAKMFLVSGLIVAGGVASAAIGGTLGVALLGVVGSIFGGIGGMVLITS